MSRRVIVMRWIEGLTVPEIAGALAITQGAVKMRLCCARGEIRKLVIRLGLKPP